MSCEYNEIIMERIQDDVLELDFNEILKELGMTFEDAYSEKLTEDVLVDMLVEKRFEECPQI
jgi:antitoxin component of RelBE/YafQ-DinJ toxin-antitoxin module